MNVPAASVRQSYSDSVTLRLIRREVEGSSGGGVRVRGREGKGRQWARENEGREIGTGTAVDRIV